MRPVAKLHTRTRALPDHLVVSMSRSLRRQFGPKQVNPKPILKRLPDIFGHSDKTVRAEVSPTRIREIWMGALNDLHPSFFRALCWLKSCTDTSGPH